MRKILVLATCMVVLLLAGTGQAATLTLGNHYTGIAFVENGVNKTLGGGSFDVATWAETAGTPTNLSFIYCVDLGHNISLNGVYGSATATTNGYANGAYINNADQVAWLLDHYRTGGNGNAAYALQAAIWHVIYDTNTPGHLYGIGGSAPSGAISLYNTMLAALDLAIIDAVKAGAAVGNVSNYLWITPDGRNNSIQAQVSFVPEAGALFLFGTGLVGLVGYRRVRRMQ
jgi:hypothetical protein